MSIRYTLRFLKEEDVNTDNLKRHELCLTDTGTIMVRLHNDEIVPLSYGVPLSSESSSSSSSGRSSFYDYSGNVGIKVNVTQSDHQMIYYSVYDRYNYYNYGSNINFSMLTPPSEGNIDYGYWTESGIGKPLVPFIIFLNIEDGYFGGRLQIEGDIEWLRFENQYQPLELEMEKMNSKGVTKSSYAPYPSLYKQKQVYVPLGGTLNISATPSLPIEHNYIVDFDGIELDYELSWTLPNSVEEQFEAKRTSDGIIKDFPVGTEFELQVRHPDNLYEISGYISGYTTTGTIDEYGICEVLYIEPYDVVREGFK